MAKVLGIGGVFVKSRDPEALKAWYRDALGMDITKWGGAKLPNDGKAHTVWSAFGADSSYFEPSPHDVMINLRVDDLDGMLARLREHGANVLDRGERGEFGAFGYVVDPDGRLVELWQPA